MPIDTDDTPPEGTLIPSEMPTSPDVNTGLRCPSCAGLQMSLSVVETNPDGTVAKALASPCSYCNGSGQVTRGQFREWWAARMGRPETGKR